MKKKLLFFILLTMLSFFYIKDTYAYDKSNYQNKTLCGNFEVALFKADGTIEQKSCHSNYDEANAAMIADGNQDLAVLGKWDGKTKIYNANRALVDFTGISGTFNIYNSYQITTEHTYMVGESGYGGVDAALLAIAYSTSANTFTANIKINGYSGWVRLGIIEIVPLVWVKSSSSYTISEDSIRHNYVTKIQNTYSGNSGNTIGPKPEQLEVGTYYSYDGHYFYKDRYTMIGDYKNGNYENSVNKEKPYYNYYQFLPQHTRTTYSSINIDEFIRNAMGYSKDVFGNAASSGTSRLYGKGAFFYNAQELYGGNALLALGVSRNESANGRSNLAINKNNGFGLNAVDSNPTQAANWFSTFSQSIYDYNNSWVTYGYSEPTDWRYFGAQNGNKYVGMNVKYASDVYWGEKMASNYYGLDKAYGLQDYNYYQTAVTTRATQAKSAPTTSSKTVFNYPSSDVGLVLLEEVEGEEVNGNKIWYKVVSDMNIDSNFNQITSGYYNWNSYVYIPAAYVYKTNEGKNGYISPNEVPEHKDKKYTYDLYIENATLKPKVAVSLKDTSYYYDATLTTKTNKTLLNNRYVMVFTTAYDENKEPVAYLVTSDYKYDQKHWVSADSIKFVTAAYGQASVTVPEQNVYTIVTPTTVDVLEGHISGLYHYAYTPIFEEKTVDGHLWYKVPVNLSGSSNIYGWTLASAENVEIKKYLYTTANQAPTITAKDITIIQGQEFKEKEGVTANDPEDGDITDKIVVTSNNVDTKTPGTYQVTYQVTDKENSSIFKTVTVTVIKNEEPVINATDKEIPINSEFDEMLGVSSTDKEDGNITESVTVIKNTVNTKELGTYEVTYQVTDSYNQTVTKTIKVIVTEIDYIKKDALYVFDSLTIKDGKLNLKGSLAISEIQHSLEQDITYKLIFENNNTKIRNEQILKRIVDKKEIPFEIKEGQYDYTYSWFEDEISISDIPEGDYTLYIAAYDNKTYYTETELSNVFGDPMAATHKENEKNIFIRNNYESRQAPIQMFIRKKEIGSKDTTSRYNINNEYSTIEFKDNKLVIRGASHIIGGDYSKDIEVNRYMIFENIENFDIKKYDIGSITNGDYKIELRSPDGKDKTRAWYETNIDVSKFEKGTYSIYISTQSNISDYGELQDIFANKILTTKTIEGKRYSFKVDRENRYRILLVIE